MVIMFLPVFCSLLTAIHSANTLSQSNFLPSLLAFCLSLVPSRPKCVSASTDHLIKKLKNMLCGEIHFAWAFGPIHKTHHILMSVHTIPCGVICVHTQGSQSLTHTPYNTISVSLG